MFFVNNYVWYVFVCVMLNSDVYKEIIFGIVVIVKVCLFVISKYVV